MYFILIAIYSVCFPFSLQISLQINFVWFFFHISSLTFRQNRNEQLRDGLLSLSHSNSELGNTLERHEQRERALGEVIKRGLQTLQKGQKIFDPMRGTLGRLEERIGQLETFLLEKDEKFNEQQTKLNKVIDLIEKLAASQEKQAGNADRLAELSNQVEDMSVNVKELRKEAVSITNKQNELPSKLDGSLTALSTKFSGKLDENAAAIEKLQEKQQSPASNAAWEETVSRDLQHIKANLESATSSSNGRANNADNGDQNLFITLNNRTLDAIADMRHEILTAADQNQLKTTAKLTETTALMSTANGAQRNGADGPSYSDVKAAIDDIKRDMQSLVKVEQMLALLGDGMLSIKRGQEFNVHKITSEVADAIKLNAIEMNETINNQIKAINQTILANHNGAMNNLTQKIETEISQVWRQIGIMYQEVSSSKDALNKLQELTEAYVNGTVSTMDSMEGKVSICFYNFFVSHLSSQIAPVALHHTHVRLLP